MTALADIPRARPASPANDARPLLPAADRRTLNETETLAGAIEDLDRARRRDRNLIDAGTRLTAQPAPVAIETPQAESGSFEYRLMSGLTAFISAAAVVVVVAFAVSLVADLPGLLARGIAP